MITSWMWSRDFSSLLQNEQLRVEKEQIEMLRIEAFDDVLNGIRDNINGVI